MIWASGTGFGETGPYAHKGGQDVIAQAYSGVMWRRSDEGVPLSVYPTTLCDYTTGMHLCQGILLALIARDRTGEGQKVQVNMYDSMLHMQMQEAATRLNRGHEVNWAAMPLSGVFPTTDGAVCMVGAFKENPLRDISKALELDEDWSAKPGYDTLEGQFEHRPELQAPVPRALRHEHHRALADPAGGAGHPLRTGAHAGGGAGRRADGGQRDGRGDGAPARRDDAGARRADPALRHPERRSPAGADARPAQPRGARAGSATARTASPSCCGTG